VNTPGSEIPPPVPRDATVEVLVEVLEGDDVIVEDIIVIEEFGKSGRKPPRAKGYKIRVDKEHLVFHEEWVTGRQILTEAKRLPPEKYILREIFANAPPEKIELDQKVHLRKHGVEKFRTMLKTAQDGQ
jgi:hypothetical protein